MSCTLSVNNYFILFNIYDPMLSFLQFKPGEIAAIMKDFEEPGSLAPTKLNLGGMKYMVIMGE